MCWSQSNKAENLKHDGALSTLKQQAGQAIRERVHAALCFLRV